LRHGLNARIGWYYATGAALVLLACGLAWPGGAVLLWPAAALALTAAAYFGLGARVYRKSCGELPWLTRLFFAPTLAGQRASLAHYARQCDRWNVVTPRVWIGRKLDEEESRAAIAGGVTSVLDLTVEFSETAAFRALDYLNVPVLDLTAPSPEQLEEAVRFIARGAEAGIVYVHCKVGYSRSAGAVGAYLIASGAARDADEAVRLLIAARPPIVIRPEIRAALARFADAQVTARRGTPA
jgi:predicted protein tyrosine phosphatase